MISARMLNEMMARRDREREKESGFRHAPVVVVRRCEAEGPRPGGVGRPRARHGEWTIPAVGLPIGRLAGAAALPT
jgi:hypothetical protein